ncbi:dna-mediated transposase [Trichonephila clavata]|uniref:Dna-mediated transposase n=1 Tax=Trichonephila clavata TaxID=2740835 RepID=A0A8X6M3E5_TRICU|nr:dna-mediated transposase [Trichonephila clavata]
MNDLEAMKTRQIVAENVKLGISSLHSWIKCFECLLHISYRLGTKKWFVRRTDRPVVDSRKKEVQEKIRRQMRLLVDAPKPGFGTSNDGNTARAFFRNPEIVSSITGIDEIIIKKLHVVLTIIACGYEIDAQKLKEFCLTTAELYVALYPWYYIFQSLHKVLIHGGLLVNDSILPIGQMSEEAIEARNKDSKYFRITLVNST